MKQGVGLSFKLRILLGCLLVALIPLLICSVVIQRVFVTSLSRITLEEGSTQIARATTQLGELFASYQAAAQLLAKGTISQQLLAEPDEAQISRFYQELYRATDGLRDGARFMVFDRQGIRRYITDSTPADLSLPVNWGALYQAAQTDDMVFCDVDYYSGTASAALMRCAQAIRTPGGELVGYLVIELTGDCFTRTLRGLEGSRNDIYVTDRFLSPIFSNVSSGMEQRLEALRREYLSTGRLVSEVGSNMLYHITSEPLSGCHILLEQPAQITGDAIELMNTITLGATVVCVILCLLVAYLLSRSLTQPVQRLNAAMEQVKAGDLTVRVENRRSDELGQLARSFNRMTEELDDYLRVSIQRQQELTDTRIRMLQAQLNPHFLYNTLDTMKWLGKVNGVPQVASLAQNLAVLLRSSISGSRFITLEQELQMARRYIDIQKIRFSGRFEYLIEVPPELLDCQVPKLILQPIIENAIIHGLQNSENGYLYIYGRAEEETLTLSVTDDGCGMSPEMVAQLNGDSYQMPEGHLGLYNASSILQMYYGPGYGLHASATREVGTTVTAKLPMQREEAPLC